MYKTTGHSLFCNENPIYVFPEKDLGGPNFHFHVSVSDLYIFPGSVRIFGYSKIDKRILEIYKALTDM